MWQRTGKQQQFGTSSSALDGGLHESRETELVALVHTQPVKPT